MKIQKEFVTPEMAMDLIKKRNPNNRRLKTTTVSAYAQMMKDGEWDTESPDNAIAIGEDGVLQNGQHRLAAIVRTGHGMMMWVWRDVPIGYHVYDRGTNRTINDELILQDVNRDYVKTGTVSAVRIITSNIFGINKPSDSQIKKPFCLMGQG